jgi:aryl-alcohol dehydrogenase-like predicted oxidoreductase
LKSAFTDKEILGMPQGLPTATLGRTGLDVTRLGYGAMEIRHTTKGRTVTEDQAKAVLVAVLDAGVNYIDTSIDYGMSEHFIGKYLSGRRDEFYLASKCGCAVVPDAVARKEHVFTRENIVAGVEQSLARMKTDYLDLVQFHISPSKELLDENDAIETLCKLQKEGKIRFLGSSSTLPNIEDHIEMGVFDVFQIPYSALQREHEEVITKAADAGSGTVIRGGVAKGEPSESGVKRSESWAIFHEAGLDDLREESESRTAFMLRFTLSHPKMHTTIVGTQNLDHLRENVEAARKGPLATDVYEEAKRRLASVGVEPAS